MRSVVALELVVASGKGGAGKSTVASALALHLHREGWDVIVVDADATAPNQHLLLGASSWERVERVEGPGVAVIDQGRCDGCGKCLEACPFGAILKVGERYVVNSVVCEGCMACALVCRAGAISRARSEVGVVRIARTRYGFTLVSAELLPGRPNSGKLVAREREVASELASASTVVVVDSAPGIGCQVIASLAGADMALLVAEPTPAGLSDLRRVHRLTRHFMQPSALVINKSDISREVSREIARYASEHGIDLVGEIPYDDAVVESVSTMMPVTEYRPGSRAAEALSSIASRVEGILRGWRAWSEEHRPKRPEPYIPEIIRPRGE